MLKTMVLFSLAGVMVMPCFPQSAAVEKASSVERSKNFYQLTFVVRELEGERPVNSRSYSIILRDDNPRGSIRAREQVPVGSDNRYQTFDVGVNIDCSKLAEAGDRVSFDVSSDISSLVEAQKESGSSPSVPVVRKNSWESSVSVPLKQSTVLFSSDDPASTRKMQLVVTVLPLR